MQGKSSIPVRLVIGKYCILTLKMLVKIRTGEEGYLALQDTK